MDPGTRLGAGRYVVHGLLGEGSQGATYAALDGETGREVAIKRFDVRGARTWKDVELAEREARVLATLDHPLIPAYVGHFEEDGALFLVMDRVDGESLATMVQHEGALPEVEVRRFLACADSALGYLHRRAAPVVHRDIKPGNVVRQKNGRYVLVDFGAVSDELLRRGSSTVVGTMGYMAPEQLQGRALPVSDVYAVGATALAALTGADPGALPHRGLRVDVHATLAGRASPELTAAIARMLEPDPDLRAPSIAAALERIGAGPAGLQDRAGEDAAVKSLRGLLWALWGIAWVIVPLVFGKIYDEPELIPVVMFGWLALNMVLGWHKGAALRMLVRQWHAEKLSSAEAPVRKRVGSAPAEQFRVENEVNDPDEVIAGAETGEIDVARERGRVHR